VNLKLFFAAALASLLIFFNYAQAAPGFEEFSDAKFAEAKKAGAYILLEFYADWCPTCKAQRKSLNTILGEPPFAVLKSLSVDYDSADDLEEALKVEQQSTLVLFKGDKELARDTGTTDESVLRRFLEEHLK